MPPVLFSRLHIHPVLSSPLTRIYPEPNPCPNHVWLSENIKASDIACGVTDTTEMFDHYTVYISVKCMTIKAGQQDAYKKSIFSTYNYEQFTLILMNGF